MTRDLDRRTPRPTNVIFEARNEIDYTDDHYFTAWITPDEIGVSILFTHETTGIIARHINLDREQCEQFGRALIDAAAKMPAVPTEVADD